MRETALNIDGAPRYRSIRQLSSHNYTSASSRMIHHIDTHDYILLALYDKEHLQKESSEEKGTAEMEGPVSPPSLSFYA